MWDNIEWLRDEKVVYETGIHKFVIMGILFFSIFLFLVITAIFFTIFAVPGIDKIEVVGFMGIELFFILILLAISIPQYMLWKKSYLIVIENPFELKRQVMNQIHQGE